MATIIDRVKKRYETDIDDVELQLIIDEANQDVIDKVGPHANPVAPITVWLQGYRRNLILSRPIDTDEDITITEYWSDWGWGESSVVLGIGDYKIWPPGHKVERWQDGNNARSDWARRVQIEYVPVNDGDQREEVIIKMVMLALQYDGTGSGLRSKSIGDVTLTAADYVVERNKLINTLMPRGGLGMA